MEVINKNSNFSKTINWDYFLRSKVYTYGFISLGLIFIASQFILPFILIDSGSTYQSSVNNSVLGAATGFRNEGFGELVSIKRDSKEINQNVPENFFIQVPKIKINNGLIKTNSFEMNPEGFIGHYAGTSLPGERGNTFIYGHSVMPFMFNEKNYKTIFSNLHKLENGDEVIIRYASKKYTYKVIESTILKPEEVDPFNLVSKDLKNSSTISLMTCTPPGTTLKRLIVNAVLLKID